MKTKLLLLVVIAVLVCGCSEYLHMPDEISIGANIAETDYGYQGKAPTTGGFMMFTFYRKEKE